MEEENEIYDAAALSKTQGGMLILKVEKFLKKPLIETDLSGILYKYEKILNNLKRKIVDINFTEAALLLQSCSLLYAKKIGILWNVTIDCQKRMIEFEVECRKRKEKAAIEEGSVRIIKNNKKSNKKQQLKQKHKDKRHKVVETQNILRNVKMRQQELENNPTLIVIDENNDKQQDDNRIKTQNLLNVDLRQHCIVEPNGLIHEEVFAKKELITYIDNLNCLRLVNTIIGDEIRFKLRYFFANCKEVSYFYEIETYLQDFLKEKNISVDDVEGKFEKEFINYMSQRQLEKEMLKEERLSEDMLDDSQDVMFDNMAHLIDPMTTKKVDSTPRHSDAISNSDSAFHEMRDESYPASVVSRRKSDSLFGETISGTNEEEICEKNTEDNNTCDVLSHNNEDSLGSVNEESFTLLELRDPDQVPTEKIVEVSETKVKLQAANTSKQKRKIECFSVSYGSDEPYYVSPKKRTRKISLAKLIKAKTVAPLKVFERFYKLNYEKSENECGYDYVVSSDSEDEDELNNFEETMAVDLSRSVTPVESALCEVDENVISINTDSETIIPTNIDTETVVIQENNDSLIEDCCEDMSRSNLLNKKLLQYAQIENESAQKVKEWQYFVIEKIKNLEEKSDFDIYDYSKKIIDLIPLNETKKFSHIANGKSAAEVSKLFMTALIMTNTNNIAILNVPSGKLANDTFELKMLNTRCQHEDLQYYKAPSEVMSQQDFDKPLPSTSKFNQNKRMKLC